MENSIILKLVFDGDTYGDKIKINENKDYIKSQQDFDKMIEKLCKDLPEKEKQQLLWDLGMAQGGLEAATADEYFKQGFKLGLTLAAQNFLD